MRRRREQLGLSQPLELWAIDHCDRWTIGYMDATRIDWMWVDVWEEGRGASGGATTSTGWSWWRRRSIGQNPLSLEDFLLLLPLLLHLGLVLHRLHLLPAWTPHRHQDSSGPIQNFSKSIWFSIRNYPWEFYIENSLRIILEIIQNSNSEQMILKFMVNHSELG